MNNFTFGDETRQYYETLCGGAGASPRAAGADSFLSGHHLALAVEFGDAAPLVGAELAEHVWATMKANDSRECRNCHSLESMNPEAQKQRARKQHEMAREDNMTCIDCHKGIAHQLPKEYEEPEDE